MNEDFYSQIEKLSALKDKGILNEDEFQQQKTVLLGEIKSHARKRDIDVPVEAHETYWLPVLSLILGVLCFLAILDDSGWDAETTVGFLIFAVSALVLGVISVSKQRKGKGMAIAGIVLGGLSLLFLIGLLAP